MTVKKKVKPHSSEGDSIPLRRDVIERVKAVISTLPTDEPGGNMTPAAATETKETKATKSTVKKKVAAKPETKAEAKTKAKAKTTAKPDAKDENVVTLAEVAKELKLEPRTARRILRDAEMKNDGRWSWTKGSAELTKVKKTLTEATAE